MIRQMDTEFISTLTDLINMKVSGRMISKKVMAMRFGRMVAGTVVSTLLLRSTAKESTHGLMATLTSVAGSTMTSKVKESTSGLTVENTVVNGKRT